MSTPGHGTTARYGRGCRCDSCRAANTAQARGMRQARQARLDSAPHGTAGGYSNWGCRCGLCKRAAQLEMAAQRESRMARQEQAPHGTAAGYNGWGCRCEPCRLAARQRERERPGYDSARAAELREDRKTRLDQAPHGTTSGYKHWGCRCDACKQVRQQAWADEARQNEESTKSAHRRYRHWTPGELQTIVASDLPARDLAPVVGRTIKAIREARRKRNRGLR